MALEIERKFLVIGDSWRSKAAEGQKLRQAYLASSAQNSVRVRIVDERRAWLTIKSGYRGITRDEFEYEVPVEDAQEMIELRQNSVIDKVRYPLADGSLIWEIDVFSGDNDGLVIAEIELDDADHEPDLPDWIGDEVTGEL
ncbi:MAG: CYTH domain-containing protein, partial [Alphaproteobacteria bacterium]|nr:CYTH domain-containing protein [Alphaproteobacteria bacterium]